MAEPFLLKLAEVTVQVVPLTDRLRPMMKGYAASEGSPLFSVEITEADVKEDTEWLAL